MRGACTAKVPVSRQALRIIVFAMETLAPEEASCQTEAAKSRAQQQQRRAAIRNTGICVDWSGVAVGGKDISNEEFSTEPRDSMPYFHCGKRRIGNREGDRAGKGIRCVAARAAGRTIDPPHPGPGAV